MSAGIPEASKNTLIMLNLQFNLCGNPGNTWMEVSNDATSATGWARRRKTEEAATLPESTQTHLECLDFLAFYVYALPSTPRAPARATGGTEITGFNYFLTLTGLHDVLPRRRLPTE